MNDAEVDCDTTGVATEAGVEVNEGAEADAVGEGCVEKSDEPKKLEDDLLSASSVEVLLSSSSS